MAIGFDPSTAIQALNDKDESFDEWKLKNAPEDTGEDYDLAGAFNANLHPAENGHFPDTFKKPNHPTFSKESIYSTDEQTGGEWGTDDQGRDTFKPSPWMGSDPARQENLKSYFKEKEPNAKLIDPDPYEKPFDPSTAIPREEFIDKLVKDGTFDPANYKNFGVSKEDAFEIRQKKKDRTLVEKTKAFASGISGSTFAEAAKGVAKFIGGLAVMTGEGIVQTVAPAVSATLKGLGYNALAKNVDNELLSERRELALGASHGEEAVKSLGRNIGEFAGDISHWASGGPRDDAKERADFDEDIAAADREKQLHEGKFIEGSIVGKIAKAGSDMFGEGKDIESTLGAKHLEEEGARKANELTVEMLSAGMDPVNIALMLSSVATGGASSIAGKAATALAEAGVAGRVASGVIRGAMATSSGIAYIPKLVANTATRTLGAAASFPFKIIRAIPSRLGRITRIGETGITAGLAAEAAMHPALVAKAAGIAAIARVLDLMGKGLTAAGETTGKFGVTNLDQQILTGFRAGQRNLLLKGSRAFGQGVHKLIEVPIDFAPFNLASSGGDPNKFADMSVGAGVFGGAFAIKSHLRSSFQKALNANAHGVRMIEHGAKNLGDVHPDIFAMHQANLFMFSDQIREEIQKCRSLSNGGLATDVLVLSPEQCDIIRADKAKYKIDIPEEFDKQCAVHLTDQGKILINTGRFELDDGGIKNFGGGVRNESYYHEIGHAVLESIRKGIETAHGQSVIEMLRNSMSPEEQKKAATDYMDALYPDGIPASEIAKLEATPDLHLDESLSEISRSLLRGQDLARYGFSQESNRIITKKLGKILHGIARTMGMGLTQMDFGSFDMKVDISGERGPQFGQIWNQEVAKAINSILHEVGQRADRKMRGVSTDADREFYQKMREKPPVPPKDPEADPSPEPEPKPKGPEPEPEPIPKPEPILKFNADDYYENGGFYYPKDMKFGDLPPQGWKAHISATPENMENVLNVVLPILNKNNIRHKFTPIERFATKDKTSNLFDKLITIYGKTPEETARILQEIDSALLSKNLTEARWKDSPENRWGKSGMISYRFGEFLGWGDTNHPTLGKVKDGFIVDEKNGKIIWDDRKNNNQVDDDLLPLLNKIPKPKPTPEPIPKVGHLTQQEIFDAAKSDPANPIGAVIDAHKRNEEDHEGGLTVQDHTDARGVPFRTVDGVLIKGDPFSEYLLNQVLVGTERRPLTQEERDIITGLKTGSVNGFVYGHAGYDIASPIIVDVSRRRKIIENPAGERIDNPSRRQNEQKRALFVNAVFNERSRTITLQMLSVDKLNNNYQNLVEAIKIANDRGEHIDNPYTTDADVVVDLKNYAENYKNNWAGDGHQPVRDADGNPLSTIGEPHKIDFDKFNFINLLLANESLKSSTRLASARRRIARANGINLEVDLESNPLRKRLNEIFPKNPETRNSWSEDLFESPHEILRPELIRGINGDIDSKGGLRNVGPEFNEAFDKGIPDENMVAGNYMPKEEDDVEYYFTVSTGRQGAINNLIENGRSAEIPEIIKLVVINAFSDMKSIPMNIEDISGLYKESQQLDPTKEPAVRVSFKYKTEEELNAIRKRFCDLGEIWDQDEIYELTHNDSSKLDIGDQTNTMERIVKSIEINIRNLTEKNILRIAEESGINGLTISNGKILIYDQANEGREFDRKSDRFRELATEETGMAEEGDVGWVALRKFGRTTDVSKAVTGYQDRIVSDPNIADPFKFRGDLIKRLMMLGRVPDAPKNGKRSYYEKDDLSPIQINRHKVLARELEEAPDFDPSALDGYDKLCDELVKQYKALTAKLSNKEFDPEGIRFEMDTYQRKDPITGEIISGDLYKSSKEAVNDLFRNKRLRILKTDADAFGPPNSEWGEHPLLRQSGEVDANGQPMTYNDLLRGVHDTIAHSMFSDQFGQIGEEGAWQVHIRTISDVDARRALTAETRSQNSFVNFGSGMQNPDGTILKKGDAGWLSPTERPFGPQKVFLPKLENCLTGDKEVDAPVLDAIAERDAKYMPEDDSSLNSEEITLGDKNVSYMPSGKKVKEKKPKEKTEWKAGEDSLMEYEGEREQIAAVLADRFKNGLDNPDLLGPLKKLIQKYPRYLNGPLDHIVKSAVRLKLGEITHRELAKAYIMTIVSQGAGAVSLDALQKSLVNYNEKMKREKKPQIKFKINPSKIFLHTNKKGKIDVRPEEIAAYWITTKDGKKALDNLDYYAAGLTPKGLKPVEGATNPDLMPAKYRPEDFAIVKLLREFYGDDRVAGSGMMIGNEWAEGQETIRESRPSWEKEPFPSKASRRDDYGYKIQAKNEDGTPKLDWSEKKRGEVTLSNLSDALLEINKNKGNDVQGMINIFLRFKGIDSAKAPFIGHFIGFGQRVTLDAVEKNYEIGGTGDSRNFAKDQQESPYKAKKNPTEDEKKEIAKIRAEIKAKNDAVKLPFRKELEVLSGSSELQELAREFIENKIDQIRAERLAKNPNDPIGKIQNEAFFHIMHHWIWDAAKGIKTTHKGLYKSMDPKYMPAEEGSKNMELARKMQDELASKIPEFSPKEIRESIIYDDDPPSGGYFSDSAQEKFDKLSEKRQDAVSWWFNNHLKEYLALDNGVKINNLNFDKDSKIKLTDYDSWQILDKLQPNRGEVPKTDRITSGFVNGNTLSENELYSIQENYSKWARRSGMTPTDLIQHIGNGNASVWSAYGTNDKFVGQFIGDTFVVSHFAPEGGKSAIGGLMDLLHTQTPVVFAVPDRIAGQLERLGFRRSKLVIPMMFKGEVMQKNLLANNAVTGSDTQKLAAWWVAESSLNGLLEKIGSSDLLDSAKEGINQLQLNSKDASYMPSEESIPEKKYKRKENEEMHKILQRALDRSEKNPQLTSEEQARINEIINEFKPVKQVPTKEILNGMPSQDEVNLAIHPDKRLKNKFDHDGKTEILSPWDKIDFDNIKTTGRQDVPAMNENNVGVVTIQQTNSEGKSFSIYVPFAVFDNNPILKAPQSPKIVKVGAGNDKKPDLAIIVGKLSRIQKIPYDIESWTQVGFNPDVHSYFYLKSDHTQGVTGGEKIVQVGNTVFVKNPVFATPEEQASYKYMPFAGEGATGFAEAEKRGDVFVNPFDFMKRFEISDDKMKSKNAWGKLDADRSGVRNYKVGDLYDHPELFKNYPWIADIGVEVTVSNDGSHASADLYNNKINVEFEYLQNLFEAEIKKDYRTTAENHKKMNLELKKTIIHEIQHFIQFKEGFAKGGDTNQELLRETLQIIRKSKSDQIRRTQYIETGPRSHRTATDPKRLKDLRVLQKDLDSWDEYYKKNYNFEIGFSNKGVFTKRLSEAQLHKLYRSISGEIEARMAASRSELTDKQRLKQSPLGGRNSKYSITTFKNPSDFLLSDINAKKLGVDRYMPLDELAEEMNIPRTIPLDYKNKQINSIMADHMEAYNFKERAMARILGQPVSSGGQGYAIKNHGTGVVWASEEALVTAMLGNLDRRGGKFQEKGKQGKNDDWFVLVAPFTMKKDALASNNEFARHRINQLREWASLNPDKYENFKKDIIAWANILESPKAKVGDKKYGLINYPFYKDFDLNNFNFATNSKGGSTFTQRKDLIQEIKRLEDKYGMPSTEEMVHHSGDPFLYGVAQRTMLQAEQAMFHSVVFKINLSANERAWAIQKYRFKQGPKEIKEVKRAFKDEKFDFSKINIDDPFDPQAQYKGTNAEEYGVDAHESYGRVVLGEMVAMLRNPVRLDLVFPDLLKRFKKFHSSIAEYRKLNNLNEAPLNISGWMGMNPMGNTVDEASPKFRIEKDQNGVLKAKSVIDDTLPLSISGQVLNKKIIDRINAEQSDEKVLSYKEASKTYDESKLKSFQKHNATISSNSVISDIKKLKLEAASLDEKKAKKTNEDHLNASRRLAIPNFFKERAQRRIDEAAKRAADKAKRDAKKAAAKTTVAAP